MQDVIIELVNQYGYAGIVLLIFIETIFPPIPSEAVLLFGGYITTVSDVSVWLVILFATVGSVLGALTLYCLGRILKKETILRLFSGKLGKLLRLKPEDVIKAEKWFIRYEHKAVFLCRFIPIVRSLISVPAGMARMRPVPFIFLTAAGTALWNTVLVWVGAAAGEAWSQSLKYFSAYSYVILCAAIALGIIAVLVFYKKKNKK